MALTYHLVNLTRKEIILFSHINASTKRELAGNNAAASIISWYLLEYIGDNIVFINEENKLNLPLDDIYKWPDVTNQIVEMLISEGILKDYGRIYEDPDDPDNIFIRDLRNIWNFEHNK